MSIILLIIGGALALEGFGWAVAPDGMREAYRKMVETMDTRQLGFLGLSVLCIGLVMIVAAVVMMRANG